MIRSGVKGMPDRISATLGRYDVNSLELGRGLREAIRLRTGNTPHVIITHVHSPVHLEASNVRALAEGTGRDLAVIIRGSRSLGTLLMERGYLTVPGERLPGPGADPYFSGGYTIEEHGSASGGTISAIQMETPWQGVRDTEAHRSVFAHAAAEAIDEFLKTWFPGRGTTP